MGSSLKKTPANSKLREFLGLWERYVAGLLLLFFDPATCFKVGVFRWWVAVVSFPRKRFSYSTARNSVECTLCHIHIFQKWVEHLCELGISLLNWLEEQCQLLPRFFLVRFWLSWTTAPSTCLDTGGARCSKTRGGTSFWDVNMMVSTDIRQSKKGVGIKLVYPEWLWLGDVTPSMLDGGQATACAVDGYVCESLLKPHLRSKLKAGTKISGAKLWGGKWSQELRGLNIPLGIVAGHVAMCLKTVMFLVDGILKCYLLLLESNHLITSNHSQNDKFDNQQPETIFWIFTCFPVQQELGLLPETFVQKWFAGLQPQSSTQLPEVENHHSEFMVKWEILCIVSEFPQAPSFFWQLRKLLLSVLFYEKSKACHDGIHFFRWSDSIRKFKAARLCIHHLPYGLLFDFLATLDSVWYPLLLGNGRLNSEFAPVENCFRCILCFMFHASRFASQMWSIEKHTKIPILRTH